MSIHFLGKRKLYIVFMTSGGLYASAITDVEGDITLKEMKQAAAQSIGAKPEDIIILNWKILEG